MTTATTAIVIAAPLQNQLGGVDDRLLRQFLANVETHLKPTAGIERFHENVWQIPLDSGMQFLTGLFHWAEAGKIQMRVLFVEEPPEWIGVPPIANNDAKAKT